MNRLSLYFSSTDPCVVCSLYTRAQKAQLNKDLTSLFPQLTENDLVMQGKRRVVYVD